MTISIPEYWVDSQSNNEYKLISIDLLDRKFRFIPTSHNLSSYSVIDVPVIEVQRIFKPSIDTISKKNIPIQVTIKHNIIAAIEYLFQACIPDDDIDNKTKRTYFKKAKEYINRELKEM